MQKISSKIENGTVEFKRAGMAFVALAKYDSPGTREILSDIESLLCRGKILKDSRSTKAVISEIGSLKVFIKRYNSRSFGHCLKNSLREPRAFRSFRNALAYLDCGIQTPEPVAAISRREHGILKNSYLVSVAVANAVPTLDFFRTAAENCEIRNKYLFDIADILYRMHSCGIVHGDTKLSNFYVSSKNQPASEFSMGIWDLDSTRIGKVEASKNERIKELTRVIVSWAEISERLGMEFNIEEIAGKILMYYAKNNETGIRLHEILLKTEKTLSEKYGNQRNNMDNRLGS